MKLSDTGTMRSVQTETSNAPSTPSHAEKPMHGGDKDGGDKGSGGMGSYGRFAAMIATSTAVMFGLMYLNTYAVDHVRFSETRFYMAILMGAVMAAIMLGFMLNMYKNTMINIAIAVGAVVVFAGSLFWCAAKRQCKISRGCAP